ncbi:hypothetical protein [Sulfitobacter sp. R18_1]|uniref:hypothetical protein n=1 Tax=Sulfitobacter sp. R18_1 TaxID=2821104 RepID=UPI001ADCDC86|nr:hypothetical protein [Sulfitobacter sp. R18_1]MBO9428306.1 hypothetical protein [Sulfitobacter sp. R18_1]
MGGRNVGCVLTGLEIMEGDPVYMASLSERQIEYEGHYIKRPPLKGIYDGYGGITLTEDVPCLGLEVGDEYEEEDTKRVFVHPDIFDGLLDVEMDAGDTFGSYLRAKNDGVSIALDDKKFFNRAAAKGIEDLLAPIALTVHEALEDYARGTWVGSESTFRDAFESKEKIENAKTLLMRAHLLRLAEMELRRPLVPFNWAPQEVGSQAREAVFERAAQIAKRMNSMDNESPDGPEV